jgi:radical SAM superfamily enzyme YgiQ (UPF0313 family)
MTIVKILIYKSYYVNVDTKAVNELNRILADLFSALEQYFLQVIPEEKPGVFGLTAYKGTLPACVYTFKFIKEKYPHIKTVMGGGVFADTHAPGSPNFEILLEKTKDYLDKIIIGQGELLFLEYLQGKLPENQRVYTKKDLDGKILDFPAMDIPDFSDFDIQKYPYLVATHSSGCLYECSFCNSVKFWGKYRKKNPNQTAAEMIKMYKKHGHQLFFMTDALLNPGISDLANELMKTGISLYYDAYFKVDEAACSIDNTLSWRRGGLYRVRLGVESGSQDVLDLMNKEITVDMIKRTVSALAQAGIKTTTYWVIGHPGETGEDFQKTLDLVEELQNDIFQAECNPFLCHFSGQAASDLWEKNRISLYPDSMDDMLVFKSWTLNCEPSREEAYARMHRFVDFCKKLNIPNPYSFSEHYNADERWKKLHKNAVPALLEFENPESYINESKQVKKLRFSKNLRQETQDFGF